METAVRKKEVKVIKPTTTHKSGTSNSVENNVPNGNKFNKQFIDDKSLQDKQWTITSITKTDLKSKEMPQIMNGEKKDEHFIEQINHKSEIVQNNIENKKWEIESIHSIEDEDFNELMTTQVQVMPFIEEKRLDMKSETEIISNGKYEIQSVIELNEPFRKVITEDKLDISSVITQDERLSSRSGSVIVEDSWVEHHTIPIHSTSVQMRTNDQPKQTMVYQITPVSKRELKSRPDFVPNPQIKYPTSTSRTEITIGSRLDEFGRNIKEKSKPVDHYTYQYEDSTKTLKLRQLANGNNKRNNNVYSSFERPTKYSTTSNLNTHLKQWPTTNCMKQSIHVDNDDEEILGLPIILDENNNPIKNIKSTQSFNSITENVSFQIHNGSAQMKIEIGVEMFHNTDKVREIWKRKKVKVTRIVELDLLKVRDKQRLQAIIDKCNVWRPQLDWTDKRGLHKEGNILTGKDAYMVFYNLMAITHEEEGEAESRDNLYLTKTPSGQLTNVICEPQFLLSGLKERENFPLIY